MNIIAFIISIVSAIVSVISIVATIIIGVKQHHLQEKQIKIDSRIYIENLYKTIFGIKEACAMFSGLASYSHQKPYDMISRGFKTVFDKYASDLGNAEVSLQLGKNYVPSNLCKIIDEIWSDYNLLLKNVVPFLYDILTVEEKLNTSALLENVELYCHEIMEQQKLFEASISTLLRVDR